MVTPNTQTSGTLIWHPKPKVTKPSWLFVLFFFPVSLLFNFPDCAQANADTATLLFPETVSWKHVSKCNKPTKEYLRMMEPQLTKAYLNSKPGQSYSEDRCPFIERIFSEGSGFPSGFYVYDMDADGDDDIIYTGRSHCSEGDMTLIWFLVNGHFFIKQKSFWPVRLERIKSGMPIRFSSYEGGCCMDIYDKYFLGNLSDYKADRTLILANDVIMPQESEVPKPFVAKDKDLILRISPETNDKQNNDTENDPMGPMVGNIRSKRFQGCKGTIRGHKIDKNSKLWYFVVLDHDWCKSLVRDEPDIDAGWVNADGISVEE